MSMTFGLFCWLVLAMVVSIIIAALVLDVLRFLILGACLGWMRLKNWYRYGWLHKDGRKTTFAPAKIVMSKKDILKKGAIILLLVVLVIAYMVVALPLIH